MKNKIEAFKKQIEAKQEELKNFAQDNFHHLSRELFETNPELISFTFRQYTPYFNDGDECVFSVNFYGDEEDFEFIEGIDEKKKDGIIELAVDFIDSIPSGTMKDIFGDHCEVKLSAGKSEVSDYQHD